ncbi:MAG: hypothetical protein H6710_18185 [Myxococcales bacterium]|nr:hypothetical protein [Myxococcales bacterium]MCB9701272.1 hypothetical protein [Myxococcales bacterium]
MSPTLANFLFEAANFLVLAGALGWLLFKPVRAALDRERERHAKEEADLKALRDEAEKLRADAADAHARLTSELDASRTEALAAAERAAAEIQAKAEKTRDERMAGLERELDALRQSQAEGLADTLGRIAATSVQRLLERVDGPSLDAALIRAASAEIGALAKGARAAPVVESARPLDAETRGLLRGALGRDFEERSDPALGAGVRVTTSAGQIDASARSLAREAARELRAAGLPEGTAP